MRQIRSREQKESTANQRNNVQSRRISQIASVVYRVHRSLFARPVISVFKDS
jgi:hypothetical protein